jgi:hypothetical protein
MKQVLCTVLQHVCCVEHHNEHFSFVYELAITSFSRENPSIPFHPLAVYRDRPQRMACSAMRKRFEDRPDHPESSKVHRRYRHMNKEMIRMANDKLHE